MAALCPLLKYKTMNPLFPFNHQQPEDHLTAFIKVLAEKFSPLYIYCFGRITESSSREGCFIESSHEQKCRYYLLMITECATRIENEVQHYATAHFPQGQITILVHGKDALKEAIHANNKFFFTVSNCGELLYSRDKTVKSFQVPCFVPTQAAVKARKHMTHHILLASGFLDSAKECLRTGKYHLSIFMLHQVVEQCCMSLIRVHIAYRADIHNLKRLLHLCDSFSPALSGLFLDESEEGHRLFNLMLKSYSAARYNYDFHVEAADAEKLCNQVSAFFEMTAVLCEDKIESLALEAEVYKQLKKESEVYYG
jgi:HEPN domain-containing protein